MNDLKARVITRRVGLYEIWCDQHSVEADPNTGFAPRPVLTSDLAYAKRRVTSHNLKWHLLANPVGETK